ncbi:uncharacterized protein LOC112452012, partial [Temnothorax curvispinosus]|uniref:Uncharacterized protein LOC112452012 n=1 Tax=Temnothorax curvispinosus TaxID=300111 RepID=A0A6J1PEE0_9HYME
MREGWLKKIGGYVLPPKVEFARICSVHFSQESFHQGRARKDPVKKRHLLPSAVPTLFLNCSEAPNVNKNAVAEPAEPNLKFNILRREFPLVVNSERRIGSSNTTSPTTSHVVVEDNIVNISTPKGIHRRSDWLDANVDIEESPPVASGPERRVCNSSPRRSVARRHDRLQNTPHLTRLARSKHRRQSSSDPLSPAWKRRKRFLMDNCTGQTSQKKATHSHVADDVDAELRHRRSLSNFFKKSLCDASAAVTSVEQECAELKMKLKAKIEEQSPFIKKNKDLKEIVDCLKKQLQEAEAEKERMSCAKEEYVRE